MANIFGRIGFWLTFDGAFFFLVRFAFTSTLDPILAFSTFNVGGILDVSTCNDAKEFEASFATFGFSGCPSLVIAAISMICDEV